MVNRNLYLIIKIKFYLDNSLVCEYTDRINTELLSSVTNEIKTLYKHVFRHVYKAIQPLDYFSNELISYVEMLTHLSQWPVLVRVD